MKQATGRERVGQVVAGVGMIATLAVAVCGALLGWRLVPGLLGEWLGTMIGAMTTPFLLEASFFGIGIALVSWLNHRRARKEGEEWVDPARFESPGETPPRDP